MPEVMTVLRAVSANALGLTITHEHLINDFSCYFRTGLSPEEARVLPAAT